MAQQETGQAGWIRVHFEGKTKFPVRWIGHNLPEKRKEQPQRFNETCTVSVTLPEVTITSLIISVTV